MKYILITLVFLAGCSPEFNDGAKAFYGQPTSGERCKAEDRLPLGVSKFTDGDTICYVYSGEAISCVKKNGVD